jgi:hypothetical protein
MIFGADARRHAAVCSRLAEECEDKHLAERLRDMASNLRAKADELEELPSERRRKGRWRIAA